MHRKICLSAQPLILCVNPDPEFLLLSAHSKMAGLRSGDVLSAVEKGDCCLGTQTQVLLLLKDQPRGVE